MTRMTTQKTQSKAIFMDLDIVVGECKPKLHKHPLMLRDMSCTYPDIPSETTIFDMYVSLVDFDPRKQLYKIRCSTTLGIGSITIAMICAFGEMDVIDMHGSVSEQNVSIITDTLLLHKQQLIHWLKS